MTRLYDALKIGPLVFFAAVLQMTIVASLDIGGGSADVLLVALVGIALLRGAIVGATAGFFAGLVVDLATLETLGFTSLLLTVAGYWIGRYGETTGRDRSHAPLLSVAVATALYLSGAFGLHFVLGDEVSVRHVLTALLPALVLNALLTVPVYALCRRVLRRSEQPGLVEAVRLLG